MAKQKGDGDCSIVDWELKNAPATARAAAATDALAAVREGRGGVGGAVPVEEELSRAMEAGGEIGDITSWDTTLTGIMASDRSGNLSSRPAVATVSGDCQKFTFCSGDFEEDEDEDRGGGGEGGGGRRGRGGEAEGEGGGDEEELDGATRSKSEHVKIAALQRSWEIQTRELQRAVSHHIAQQENILEQLIAMKGSSESRARRSLVSSQTSRSSIAPSSSPSCQSASTKDLDSSEMQGEGGEDGDMVTMETNHSAIAKWLSRYRRLRYLDRKKRQTQWVSTVSSGTETRIVQKFLGLVHWWHHLEEPPRQSNCLYSIVKDRRFECGVAFVILLNVIFMTHQNNLSMDHLGGPDSFDSAEVFAGELCFLFVYTTEILLKLWVHRLYFFCNEDWAWNTFDAFLVVMAGADAAVTLLGPNGGQTNVTFARAMRFFKIGKTLRVLKSLRFLKELRVMVYSIYGSFLSLFWSIVLIGMILYIFALFFMQQITFTLAEKEALGETGQGWERDRQYFRTVQRSMLTLLEAAMGGLDWDMVFIIVEPLGIVYIAAFIFFILFFNFAVMNILTGIFVEKAMNLCRPDTEEQDAARRRQHANDKKEISMLAEALDHHRRGFFTRYEFTTAAKDEHFVSRFAVLGIDIRHAGQFFDTIAGIGAQHIQVKDFVEKAVRLQGIPNGLALQHISLQLLSLQNDFDDYRALRLTAPHPNPIWTAVTPVVVSQARADEMMSL